MTLKVVASSNSSVIRILDPVGSSFLLGSINVEECKGLQGCLEKWMFPHSHRE
jgi:hypothetical protein